MPAVQINDLCFSYENAKVPAVNNVSFELKHGSYTVLAGKNGSGKSTVAKIIAGLLKAQKGSVQIEEGLRVGIIFQSPKDQIICGIVFQDTQFGPENLGFSKAEVELNVIESLSATEMLNFANHRTMNLSLGQTQKVALSGILAMDPDILILDEAFSMLDPKFRNDIYDFVESLNNKGITVLHISHDKEAIIHARDVIFMQNGKISWSGTSKEFLESKELVQKLTGKTLLPCNKNWTEEGKTLTLSAQNITFSYDKKKPILKNISFNLYKGTLTALVGPSGIGKSTLLEILSGLLTSDSGKIYSVSRPAICQQNSDAALFENYVADDVAFGPINNGVSGPELRKIVEKSMNQCNLDFNEYASRQTFCLSGGEKKRLAVAGIVALDSEIILFDEPTAALDGESREKVMNLMRTLSEQGKTVLFTTHQKDEVLFADRVINLSQEVEENPIDSDFKPDLPEMPKIEALSILKGIQNFSFSWQKDKKKICEDGKLPPVFKVCLFLLLFCFSLFLSSVSSCAVFFVVSVLYAIIFKVSAKKMFLGMVKIVPLLLFFCLFQMIFTPALPDEVKYCSFRFFTVTPSKILNCVKVLLRTECALCLICGFASSVNDSQLLKGFDTLLFPLKLLHIPIKYILVTMEIIFRFLPLLLDEACCIVKTQLVRGGLGKAKGIFKKIIAIVPLIVPLVIQSLKRAEALSEALTARGFK